MKSTFVPLFSALCLSVMLFSCQPEPVEELPEEPDTPTSSHGELLVYATLDTVYYPKGLDTITKYSYSYDGSGRVKKILLEDFDGSERLFWRTEERIYSGAEKNPYKIVLLESEYPTAPQYYDTIFLSYNNGIVVTDSSVKYDSLKQWLGATAIEHHFDASSSRSKTFRRSYYHNWSGGPVRVLWDTVVSRFSIVNGNIVSAADTVRTEFGDERIDSYQYMFDDKKNPFLPTVVPAISAEYISETSGYGRRYGRREGTNNVTRIQTDIKGQFIDPVLKTEVRKYKYDTDGTVLSFTVDGTDEKHVFIYKQK
jgi:hypothetical protein